MWLAHSQQSMYHVIFVTWVRRNVGISLCSLLLPYFFIREADEVTHRVFQEHNDAVADGSLKIDKPWLQISPIIHFEAPGDANCTRAYVGQLLNSDSIAENAQAEKCAAPHGCCIPKEDMYLCELCRHWLHLNCIRDQRKAPKSDEAYLCPVHFSSKSFLCYISICHYWSKG